MSDLFERRVEAGARALCRAQNVNPDGARKGDHSPPWKLRVPYARAALKAADAVEGVKVVPVEPTEAMKAAANRLNHPRDEEIYRAMIAAAPDGGG